ncbi:magnesium transporter [Halapricum hydrolyticum]|uniref:Magnesium transporter n=1 Tax=Halapricum hydrolyticum TaxID=2979991 RepID=A0AAE3ICQ9_9EURY|nr:magnesium transporter [Halapricum hydrolyticum]MCU4719516.1 magnesium transporter [Halapricum hydrolyticum]MCU4728200.1 magnesium transporter [Halapricum hydrolyticum]
MVIGSNESLGSWQASRIVRNMIPLLIVLSMIVLVAGVTLENAQELLAEYGILAVMVPTMIASGGNLGAILSARLSTRFHLGLTELRIRDRTLWANVAAIFALGLTVFTTLALGAYAIAALAGDPAATLFELLTISLVSGIAIISIAVVLSFAATWASYRLGIDPDNVTIPIVTNVVDVFGMIIFIGVASAVLGF